MTSTYWILKKIVRKQTNTSSSLSLILFCLFPPAFIHDLLPTLYQIVQIVHDSLLSGSFPSVFKRTVIKTFLKKSTLDHNNLKNYRPVSNFSFLSKVIEKVVLKELFTYLNSYDLFCPFQSAYYPCHSTQTSLLKMANEILLAGAG